MTDASPHRGNLRPHPLAEELARRLHGRAGARILEIGTGSRRNRDALEAAGFFVAPFEPRPPRGSAFDAAISTHGLLHGTHETIAARTQEIAALLKTGAPLYATFASIADERYGKGVRVAPGVYAAQDGDERGVPHAFYDRAQLRGLLEEQFAIESIREVNVADIVGTWAHAARPAGSVHFFVTAVRR